MSKIQCVTVLHVLPVSLVPTFASATRSPEAPLGVMWGRCGLACALPSIEHATLNKARFASHPSKTPLRWNTNALLQFADRHVLKT
jgi:hypothetical protein